MVDDDGPEHHPEAKRTARDAKVRQERASSVALDQANVAWLACFVTIPLRNFLVTGTLTALPTEGPPTLWYGNRPPEDVYTGPVSQADHHTFLTAVWTYLVREPGYFLTQVLQRAFFTFGFHSARHYSIPIYVQFSLVEFVTWLLAALGATLAIRQRVGGVVIVMLAACRWASMVVFLATERYLVTLVFLLVPLAAVGLHSIWRFRPMLAALVVLALGTEHYIRTSPNLGPHVAWPGGRLIGSASYHTMRQRLSWQSPIKVPLRWTFPEDTAQWQPTPTMGVIDDETPTFQFLLGDEGVIASPQLGVAAPLIEAVEIEARFTGMDYMARLVWHRPGMQPGVAFFPVDGTGVRRTYRVAVWQSRDWSGMIDSIAIGFNGDSIEPTRIELVPYADVAALVTRPASTATH